MGPSSVAIPASLLLGLQLAQALPSQPEKRDVNGDNTNSPQTYPGLGTPNIPVSVPNYGVPSYGIPSVSVPNYGVPNYGIPSVNVPNYGVPNFPNVNVPGFQTIPFGIPGFPSVPIIVPGSPNYPAPAPQPPSHPAPAPQPPSYPAPVPQPPSYPAPAPVPQPGTPNVPIPGIPKPPTTPGSSPTAPQPPTLPGMPPTVPGMPPTSPPMVPGMPLTPPGPGMPPTPPGPGMPPTGPVMPPTTPGMPPMAPGMPPTVPGMPPTVPGMPPTVPGMPPTTPGSPPTTPGMPPTVPGMPPTSPGSPPTAPPPNSSPPAAGSCGSFQGSQYQTIGGTYTIQCMTDRPGGDIGPKSANTFKDCFSICDSTNGCVGFAWVGGNGPGTCYLKSAIGSSTPNANVDVAYVPGKQSTYQPPVPAGSCGSIGSQSYTSTAGKQYAVLCQTDVAGGDIGSKPSDTFKGCFDLCDQTSGCLGFTYLPGTCYFKGSMGQASSNPNVNSAFKSTASDGGGSGTCPPAQIVTVYAPAPPPGGH